MHTLRYLTRVLILSDKLSSVSPLISPNGRKWGMISSVDIDGSIGLINKDLFGGRSYQMF